MIAPSLDGMTESEKEVYFTFCEAHKQAKGNVSTTEEFHLSNAGLEYIKYLRLTRDELISHMAASQSKHHPLIQFRAELDMFYGKGKEVKQAKGEISMKEFFDRGASDVAMPVLPGASRAS